MKRLLSPLLALSLFLLSTGWGNVFVRGAVETGSTIQGSVTVVQLGNTLNGMETVQVTFVTLLQNGTSFTIGFCGDQSVLFPLDQTCASISILDSPARPSSL